MVENLAQLDAKEDRKVMTLSIGDGADDAAMIVMIQEVNVGCGLLGHAALKVQTFTSCYARGLPVQIYDKVVTHTRECRISVSLTCTMIYSTRCVM